MSVDVYNSLLYWMSERGNLATQTVKGACNGWNEQLKLRMEKPLKKGGSLFMFGWMDSGVLDTWNLMVVNASLFRPPLWS